MTDRHTADDATTGPSPRILVVEDRPEDYELVQRELRQAGLEAEWRCVDNREAMIDALERFDPDVVLSDYALPSFSATEALQLTLARKPLVPFIVVTGSIDEETAVECIKAGAADYVIKERLTRLASAVQNALELKRVREEQLRAEQALERSQEMLRQAQKMEAIGRLAGGIAHDFNNLITAVLGYADLLMQSFPEDDDRTGDVEEIRSAAKRAAELTQQLLAFSRKQVMERRVVSLNDVVANIDKLLRRVIGEDVELDLSLGPEAGNVLADPGQLEQVILNVAVNARDAMPDGGKLTIETQRVELDVDYVAEHPEAQPGLHAVLAISDTGHGMDAATRERIFEPFFTTKERGKGTGLGLATAYGIVRQSGGHIYVYSEPGQGTTFKIYFPRVQESADAVSPAPRGGATLRGSEAILLVEDEEAVRTLARRVLSHYGYEVLETTSVEEALRIGAEYPDKLHLLLTDVVMPRMTGPVLAERLLSERPEMRVLFMSGYAEHSALQHGIVEQKAAYLQKPFTAEGLARKVREVLEKER